MYIDPTDLQFVTRLSMAVFFGSAIGFERQCRQRMAGIRTNTLVAAGAASFVMLSQNIPNNGDETHVLAYIVSGVGFLGAGVIMKEGVSVTGLNTAATLWCAASVGAIAGFGFGFKAGVLTLAILATNTALRPVARRVTTKVILKRKNFGRPGLASEVTESEKFLTHVDPA